MLVIYPLFTVKLSVFNVQKYPGYFVKTRKWAKKALQVRLFNLLIISYLVFYPTAYVTSKAQIPPVHNIDFQAVTPLLAAL